MFKSLNEFCDYLIESVVKFIYMCLPRSVWESLPDPAVILVFFLMFIIIGTAFMYASLFGIVTILDFFI